MIEKVSHNYTHYYLITSNIYSFGATSEKNYGPRARAVLRGEEKGEINSERRSLVEVKGCLNLCLTPRRKILPRGAEFLYTARPRAF